MTLWGLHSFIAWLNSVTRSETDAEPLGANRDTIKTVWEGFFLEKKVILDYSL